MYLSGATSREIADIFLTCKGTVLNILKRSNIERRKSGKRPNIPILLKGNLLEIVNGHLLGDGSIPEIKRANYIFRLKNKYQDYVKFTVKILEPFYPIIVKWRNKVTKRLYYDLQTKSLISPEFREKWYPNNIKTIPNDLILTPITCLYWYIDDGCLSGCNNIILSTQSFLEENLEKTVLIQLRNILDCKDESVRIRKDSKKQPIIIIPRRFVKRFLEYIGPCPVECYDYKWDIKPYKIKGYGYV